VPAAPRAFQGQEITMKTAANQTPALIIERRQSPRSEADLRLTVRELRLEIARPRVLMTREEKAILGAALARAVVDLKKITETR
jgi:hypothetical protein